LFELSQVRLRPAHALGNLYKNCIFLQRHFVSLLQILALFPVHVADEVAWYIIYHDTLIERVKSKEAILPALLLAANVVRVEAVEFKDWSCVLAGRDGE
jgi:hypothetical protein